MAGHWAGGHLALWCAARARLPSTNPLSTADPLQPSAVLGLAAIADLELYAAGASDCERATVSLLGGVPADVPERFAATSPVRLLPTGLPVMLLQGELDPIVPADQPESYLRAALDRGDQTRLRYVPGAGHFDFIHPGTLASDTALASLREFA